MTIDGFISQFLLPHDPVNTGCVNEQLKRKAVKARIEKGIVAAIKEAYKHYGLRGFDEDIKKIA